MPKVTGRRQAAERRLSDAGEKRVAVGKPADREADGKQRQPRGRDADDEGRRSPEQQERQQRHESADRETRKEIQAPRPPASPSSGPKGRFPHARRCRRRARVPMIQSTIRSASALERPLVW